MTAELQDWFRKECKKLGLNPEDHMEDFLERLGQTILTEEHAIVYVKGCKDREDKAKEPKKTEETKAPSIFNSPDTIMTEELPPIAFSSDERKRLLMLKCEASSRYWNEKKDFLSVLLSTDLRSFLHIVTLKDNPKEIYIYNSETGLYEKHGYQTLRAKISFILGNSYSEFHAKAVIYHITSKTLINREDFFVSIQFVPFKNGILDIGKNPVELIDYSEKFYFTKKLPTIYNPKAECPKFLKFLKEILPEEKDRLQIQEMFGWTLWRKYSHQIAFMLVGEGSNGKSTLLAALRFLLGIENTASISLQEICMDKFASADLYQKFANISDETRTKRLEESKIFKSLTDGLSVIRAQRKHGQPFEFLNYGKLIFAMNEVPPTKDRSPAFYRRWIIIIFSVRFVKSGVGGLLKDINIIDKLTTPEELSGILNWALEGLKRLNNQSDFSESISIEETEKCYERLSNPVGTYLIENIEEMDDDGHCIVKNYLWNDLLYYCKMNKVLKPTPKRLNQEINAHFENVKSKQRKVGEKERVRVWTSCRFKNDMTRLSYNSWLDESELKAKTEEPKIGSDSFWKNVTGDKKVHDKST